MGTYEQSTTVAVPPARLFAYLADVRHLPGYLPRLTSAEPTTEDKVAVSARIDPPDGPPRDVTGEAWMKVTAEGRSLQWGAPGPDDYHGELDVDPGDDAHNSRLTIRLHTERVDGPPVDDGLAEALDGLKRAVEQAEGV